MMTGQTTSFANDIARFVQKTKIKADMVVRKLALDGLRGVMLKSPVDTGRFRASWRVAINQIDKSVEPDRTVSLGQGLGVGTIGDATGVLSSGNGTIATAKWGDAVYITNNVVYGPPLEYGWSGQAPNGMLRLTLLELQSGLAAALASVK